MLSFSIFETLMAKHRKYTDIKIKYVSNNLEPFNRSKVHLNYNNPYPNDTLSTKYNFTEHIYLTNKPYMVDTSF